MPRLLKIGAVSYLNTKPLVYGLAQQVPHVRLTFDLPSRLADQLRAGHLDVALVPVVEYFHGPDYVIVSDACIACRGPVLSVKLFFRVPAPQVRTLALDEGSRTSAILARTLLRSRLGLKPELRTLPIGEGLASADADAVLLIGDRAIHADETGCVDVWDLGHEWCRATGYPFVFALWIGRPDLELDGVSIALASARNMGTMQLETIAAENHRQVGLSRQACLEYLRDNLHFHFGIQEQQGLRLFQQRASDLGLLPHEGELRFHDCQVA